jgi:phosphoglycolate phosphatase
VVTRCADETFSKPNPTMLYEILDALGVPAEQAVMVGDTPQDLQMAACAHIDSVGVAYGDTACQALRAYHPQTVCQSVAELQRWLLQS